MPDTLQDNLFGKVQFVQNHKPALETGKYTVSVSQNVNFNDHPFKSDLTFIVTGDPFELNPQDIHTVFPPAGSSGDHSHVLPHIVLKRSTLPWEMQTQNIETQEEKEKEEKNPATWLALLVIYEEETQGESPSVLPIRTLILDQLKSKINNQDLYQKEDDRTSKLMGKVYFPGLGYASESDLSNQTGHHFTDKVTVLDVKKDLLQTILPSLDDLRYLAHVRQTSWNIIDNKFVYSIIREDNKLKFAINNQDDESKAIDFTNKSSELKPIIDALTIGTIPETIKTHLNLSKQAFLIPSEALATIIANRLPKQDGTSTVYLVSLQNRYNEGKFNYQTEDNNAYIRLITLKSWSFSCPKDSNQSFSGLLQNLTVDTLRLLPPQNQNQSEQGKNDEKKKIADLANQYLNK